jgi:UDP-glucose 4-epimerase
MRIRLIFLVELEQSWENLSPMTKILITGGAGFIGSHTADWLLENGHDVVVFDNLTTGKQAYLSPKVKFIHGDVLDLPLLQQTLQDCDAVLHLAALPSVPKSIEDPVHSLHVNTLGFLNVLQAIRNLKKSIRLVYASSAAVYGNAEKLPCSDEVLPDAALSPYALEKANNERYAELFSQLFGIKSLGLRYFNVYGVRQDPNSPYTGVIAKFLECYQQDKSITIFGNGEQSRDFISVTDVAKANALALASDYSGVLNIATGVPQNLKDLVKYLEKAGKKPAKIEYAPERLGDIPKSYAKVDKAERFLKFKSTISLEQGVANLWYDTRLLSGVS